MSAAVARQAATANRVPDRSQLVRWVNLLEKAVDLIDAGDHIVSDNMYATAKALVDQVADEMYAANGAMARAAWESVLGKGAAS